MKQTISAIINGVKSYIPGLYSVKSTSGTDSARYCYSVWLRHISFAYKNGLNSFPQVIAELGPGDSIGIGLAALISGAKKYYALDIVEYAYNERNLNIFDELVELFRLREPIPGENEFPELRPRLDEYGFPSFMFSESALDSLLDKSRIYSIRDELTRGSQNSDFIRYVCPWHNGDMIEDESVDFIYSQAVLEHVDALNAAYQAMYRWLKPEGFMSHQIDFRCHGTAEKWNGHWGYPDLIWKLIRGKRPYLLNREPFSAHIRMLEENGFDNIKTLKVDPSQKGIDRNNLYFKFRKISEEDLHTATAHILSKKLIYKYN